MSIFTKKINYGDGLTPMPQAQGPQKPVNPFSLTGNGPTTISTTTKPNTGMQTSTPAFGGSTGLLVKTANAQVGQPAKSPEMNVRQPDNGIKPNQAASAPAASPTGSFQGGQAVPAPGTPEYNQSVANAQRTQQQQSTIYPQNQQPQQPQNGGLYGQLIAGLAQRGTQSSPEVEAARENLKNFQLANANNQASIASNPNYSLDTQVGRGQIVANQYSQQLPAMQANVTNALTQQGQQITALGSAGNLAQPVQVPYSNQFVDPTTGQPVGGGQNGGSLQTAVQNVISRLQAGTMTYDQAAQALSGYGQGGVNALQQSLPPSFNIAQSNTLAGQQGSVGVNYQLADAALNNVENLMKQLAPAQRTNIPAINSFTQGFSTATGLGSEQTRAVTGAVQSLRNAYAALLASARGGTPTDYSGQAQAEIPDQPTPNDIAAIRHNFETLGQVRRNILGNPGQAGNQGGTQGGTVTWDTL